MKNLILGFLVLNSLYAFAQAGEVLLDMPCSEYLNITRNDEDGLLAQRAFTKGIVAGHLLASGKADKFSVNSLNYEFEFILEKACQNEPESSFLLTLENSISSFNPDLSQEGTPKNWEKYQKN